jgi:dTDP-4-amino-4,6-dideoxygalactose transaminase
MSPAWSHCSPAAGSIELAELLRRPHARERRPLDERLARRLQAPRVRLCASGREALRVGLKQLARRSGRCEVILPAYACWSVPAAAVAAGLRVRLVDVDERGGIAPEALWALPLERACAVVVGNLFGIAEPVRAIETICRAAGVAVVEDAAQSLGAWGRDGPVGARTPMAVLSFGRGKPLEGLGGGALVCRDAELAVARLELPRARPTRALLRAVAWRLARMPALFRLLEAIPALAIGETRFAPGFARGRISGESLLLCARSLERFEARAGERARVAERLALDLETQTGLRPLLARPGDRGVYPRLAVLAADRETRDRALACLAERGAGASRLYPSSLDTLAPLRPHRTDDDECRGAQALAARLLTLPTHGGLAGRRWQRALAALRRVAAPGAVRSPLGRTRREATAAAARGDRAPDAARSRPPPCWRAAR